MKERQCHSGHDFMLFMDITSPEFRNYHVIVHPPGLAGTHSLYGFHARRLQTGLLHEVLDFRAGRMDGLRSLGKSVASRRDKGPSWGLFLTPTS